MDYCKAFNVVLPDFLPHVHQANIQSRQTIKVSIARLGAINASVFVF